MQTTTTATAWVDSHACFSSETFRVLMLFVYSKQTGLLERKKKKAVNRFGSRNPDLAQHELQRSGQRRKDMGSESWEVAHLQRWSEYAGTW
jgi:hypothetical protein